MKKDAYYFPHFCNARADRKLKRLRKELGIEGYGIYFMVLEVLREQTDFKYPTDDIDLLADEFGTSEQKALAVITNYSLFDITEDECFFSPKLIEYMTPYLENKERKILGGVKGNLIKYNKLTRAQIDKMTDEEIMKFNETANSVKFSHTESVTESDTDRLSSQSKVKESKVKESKVNKKIYTQNFEHFWEHWKSNIKNDSNKKKTFDSFKRLSDTDMMQLFESVIPYGKSNRDHCFLKRCETYVNQRHWESIESFSPVIRSIGDF